MLSTIPVKPTASSLHSASARTRKLVIQGLKIVLVAALFWLLASRGLISVTALKNGLRNWTLSLPATLVMVACQILGILRWQWLLQSQGIHLPFGRVAQLSLIGNFFNFALPGAVSGDLVKAFYIGKEIPGRRGNAFGSILFDRIVGVSALVIVSAMALLAGWGHFSGSTLEHGIRILLVTGLSGVIAFYAYLFTVREKHDPFLNLLKGPLSARAAAGSILRVYEGVRVYHSSRGTVIRALTLSCVIHLGVVTGAYLYAQALGGASLEWLPVAVIVPLGLLATAVPVLPGGVGTGHAAFAALFLLISSAQGADVYNLMLIPSILFTAIGGGVYLRFRSTMGLPPEPAE